MMRFLPGPCCRAAALLLLILCSAALLPAAARACTLDNTASLSANGVRAEPTLDLPRAGHPWAPFTVAKAFAAGSAVRITEAHADLQRTLTAQMLGHPFRWILGDGSVVTGTSALHRYQQPGTYHIQVYAYTPHTRQWLQFDSILISIVPPAQILQANLAYYALQAFNIVFSSLWHLITVLLGVLLAYVLGHGLWSRLSGQGQAHQETP